MSRRNRTTKEVERNDEGVPKLEIPTNKCDGAGKLPRQISRLKQVLSWPANLFSWICAYVAHELNPMISENKLNNFVSEETNQLVSSIVAFLLGFIVFRTYEDLFGVMLTTGLKTIRGLLNLGCEGLEALFSGCLVLLFWIGGIRLLRNFFEKILKLPKTYDYHDPE